MGKFAVDTDVSSEKSQGEIQRILSRYGATHYGHMTGPDSATVAFQANNRRLRFTMPMPGRSDLAIDGRGHRRTEVELRNASEKAWRQRWRALCLVIKAKLEAVECGVATFEEEFMANIILPSGQTMAEYALPQIAEAYKTNKMPPLLGYTQ